MRIPQERTWGVNSKGKVRRNLRKINKVGNDIEQQQVLGH